MKTAGARGRGPTRACASKSSTCCKPERSERSHRGERRRAPGPGCCGLGGDARAHRSDRRPRARPTLEAAIDVRSLPMDEADRQCGCEAGRIAARSMQAAGCEEALPARARRPLRAFAGCCSARPMQRRSSNKLSWRACPRCCRRIARKIALAQQSLTRRASERQRTGVGAIRPPGLS